MYCANCEAEIQNGADFCPYCGERVEKSIENRAASAGRTGSGTRKWKPILFAAVVCVASAIILIQMAAGNKGYESVVSKYFEAIEEDNPGLLLSITSDKWIEDSKKGWGMDEEDLYELMEESIQDVLDDFDCGDHVKIKYRIMDVYKPDEDELQELESDLYEIYGYYLYNRDEFRLDSARSLEVLYTVTGEYGETSGHIYFIVIKEDGVWKIPRGAISGSWY